MPSSHLILCHPLLLLPPIPPSIEVFFNESTLRMRWPKYWSFSFSIIPSKEFNITVIQVYAPTSNTKEAEVERFSDDLQDLLELTPKKDVLFNVGN